ncbi:MULTISPECIES: CBS domain-containing protein [Thioalkalivibrio]|uniref:CBS domain-containing protein n=1 Tax=Thioalkalivibrio TaxID=106633 RepID=UPI00036812E2|nr:MULTISPECIES: CBS domain-containing protein [Thioalkalivibrio]
MSAGEYANRDVIVVEEQESVRTAVNMMREHHVGTVVVVARDAGRHPIPRGILTDRDVVLEILAEGVDLDEVTIGDVMSYELVTVPEKTGLMEVIEVMRDKGVRRVPVVDNRGTLIGILSVDDVLELISEQLEDLVRLIGREQRHERTRRK